MNNELHCKFLFQKYNTITITHYVFLKETWKRNKTLVKFDQKSLKYATSVKNIFSRFLKYFESKNTFFYKSRAAQAAVQAEVNDPYYNMLAIIAELNYTDRHKCIPKEGLKTFARET